MDRKPEDDLNRPQYSAVVAQALDKGLTMAEAAELERKNVLDTITAPTARGDQYKRVLVQNQTPRGITMPHCVRPSSKA